MNIAQAVASNLRRLRSTRGLTTQALERRLTEIGYRIARSSLTNMELGRREVSLEDIAALAMALEVPPLLLIAPVATEPTITVLGTDMDSWQFAQWFAGRAPLSGTADDEGDYDAFVAGSAVIRLRINHDAGVKACLDLKQEVWGWENGIWSTGQDGDVEPTSAGIRDRVLNAIEAPAPVPAEVRQKLNRAESQLRLTRAHLAQQGCRVPELPEGLRYIDNRRMELRRTDEGFYWIQVDDADAGQSS
jgi:transcriptional regulator with XRE-family HTH domain